MRTGQCFLLVYSITDQQSFTEAEAMYNFTTRIKDTDNVPAVSTASGNLHCVCVCVCVVCVCVKGLILG